MNYRQEQREQQQRREQQEQRAGERAALSGVSGGVPLIYCEFEQVALYSAGSRGKPGKTPRANRGVQRTQGVHALCMMTIAV